MTWFRKGGKKNKNDIILLPAKREMEFRYGRGSIEIDVSMSEIKLGHLLQRHDPVINRVTKYLPFKMELYSPKES